MATCRVCNAPLTWGVNEEGAKIPIDDHQERDYGPGRYTILTGGAQPVVRAIAEESPLRTYVDHRVICQEPRAI